MIKSEIVAHSLNQQGDEIISVLCTFPRIILAEVNTHRMLSKNTSSSRAIPFNKMLEAIEENPFIPIAWQKEHSGMQGSEYFTDERDIQERNDKWLQSCGYAIENAKSLHNDKVTKQLCNRLLEPFMWTTMLITGPKSGWDNFFNLRCPAYTYSEEQVFKSKKQYIQQSKNDGFYGDIETFNTVEWLQVNKGQAEIHMMALAECIWDSVNESTPLELEANQWHIPFEDKLSGNNLSLEQMIKCSVSLAARTSYTVVGEEKEIDYQKMIDLHDRLLTQDPPHSSPFEHCARAMSDDEYYTFVKGRIVEENKREDGNCDSLNWIEASGWCYNLKGFIPYRYFIDNKENI